MLRRSTLLAFLVAVLPLAACGDDSLTAAQLHEQASAICARTAAATDRIAMPNAPAQGARFLQQGLAHLRPAAAQLRALKAPEELRERYDRAVGLAQQEIALIARHEREIGRGEDVIDSYRRLDAALEPLVGQENAYWQALQLDACVRR